MKNRHTRQLSAWVVLIIAAVLAACSSPAEGGVGDLENGSSTVNAVATDFKFSLDASQARAGTVTFVVQNDGNMPHDFAISGNGVEQKTPMIDPGKTGTLTVELEPGTYDYVCTVPGHSMLGMRGTFTVTPGS